jgi:hypothetical protein
VHGNGHKPTKTMKKSEKTHQGLYNVGFIGAGESELESCDNKKAHVFQQFRNG